MQLYACVLLFSQELIRIQVKDYFDAVDTDGSGLGFNIDNLSLLQPHRPRKHSIRRVWHLTSHICISRHWCSTSGLPWCCLECCNYLRDSNCQRAAALSAVLFWLQHELNLHSLLDNLQEKRALESWIFGLCDTASQVASVTSGQRRAIWCKNLLG